MTLIYIKLGVYSEYTHQGGLSVGIICSPCTWFISSTLGAKLWLNFELIQLSAADWNWSESNKIKLLWGWAWSVISKSLLYSAKAGKTYAKADILARLIKIFNVKSNPWSMYIFIFDQFLVFLKELNIGVYLLGPI